MTRKIIFTILWTIGFFAGSFLILVFLFGFIFGFFSFFVGSGGGPVQQNGLLIRAIGVSLALAPLIFGAIGLVLGILGRLPGTKLPHIEDGK